MKQLICKNLALGYDGKIIKENMNFSVNKGDFLCVVGENGSGKSTLIKAILRLHPQIKGEITFFGGLKPNTIGYLPQQSDIQKDFPASVWEVVLSGCINKTGFRPFYTKNEKMRAKINMEKIGISNLAKSCYRELSGGQQQRVLLARALCAAENMLVLDEPVSGLDSKSTLAMYRIIKELNDGGTTVIMISHDLKTVLHYASHILLMNEELFFGSKEEYINCFADKWENIDD